MDLVEKYLGEVGIPVKSKMAKHDERDKADIWRAGFLEIWSQPMKSWIRQEPVTIKPNVSVKKLEKELAKENMVGKAIPKVRIYIPDR